MTEPVLDLIQNQYGHREGFRVIIMPAEAVIPRLEVEEKQAKKQTRITIIVWLALLIVLSILINLEFG